MNCECALKELIIRLIVAENANVSCVTSVKKYSEWFVSRYGRDLM